MLSDRTGIALFLAVTIGVSVLFAISLPGPLAGLRLRRLIPVLAIIGPVLCALLILVGAGAMLLAGHEVEVLFIMATAIGLSVAILGTRLARPLAEDMALVSNAIQDLARGERRQARLPGNTAEAMALMQAVEELRLSLIGSETAREQADAHRKAVVAGLSHDLRMPLHSMLAATDALVDGMCSLHEQAVLAGRVSMNARMLDRLVNDLFLIAQAESGHLRFEVESVELSELVEDIVEAVQSVAAARDVSVSTTVDRRVVVKGDEMAIGRILGNLVDNAIRHTPPGGSVVVAVDTTVDDDAVVLVRDDGPGFPATDVQPESPDDSHPVGGRRGRGGVGLGLTIASTLAGAVGGEVSVVPGSPGVVLARFQRSG